MGYAPPATLGGVRPQPVLRLGPVSFCGGQGGGSGVTFPVHLEPVMPPAAPISQCHSPCLEVAPATISRPAPAGTKSAYQPLCKTALSHVISSRPVLRLRVGDDARHRREKARCPSSLPLDCSGWAAFASQH